MDEKAGVAAEGGGAPVRGARLPCGCDDDGRQNQPRGPAAAMPGARGAERLRLTAREHALYQAGVRAGAAHAYQELARQHERQQRRLQAESTRLRVELAALLDRAGAPAGVLGRAASRLRAAAAALLSSRPPR